MSKPQPSATEASKQAVADADRHANNANPDPVPMPEDGGHAHSAAAHLGKHTEGHTKPVVNQHPGTTRDQSRTRSK